MEVDKSHADFHQLNRIGGNMNRNSMLKQLGINDKVIELSDFVEVQIFR